MDVPSVSAIRSVLIASRVGAGAESMLVLSPNQVVTGTILDIQGALTRISIGGHTIVAETEANLTAGTAVQLRVGDVSADKITLQLVDQGTAGPTLRAL